MEAECCLFDDDLDALDDTTSALKWKKDIFQDTSLAVRDGGSFHFLVTQQKGTNYTRHCNKVLLSEDPFKYLRQYSEHTNNTYAQVNLSLASDSTKLEEYGEYIDHLRAAVLSRPLLDDGLLYRGVSLSQIEMDQMERLRSFFIPSFTSTSIEMGKIYDKNTILIIKTAYMSKYGCSMTEECSDYYSTEREVLLACYSAYYLEKIEKVNSKNYISLYLDESSSCLDALNWGY
eukprot:TRINITY_DN25054_c0_g1_i1.p1 TRINITY_DN25054_c0_g1~~TRINITY_DN25054_c0_g1_i1.p1  ORF type:complete len:232 (-),score=54.69 TRINITY_DN25054_c0_g1_i1:17-712(-)